MGYLGQPKARKTRVWQKMEGQTNNLPKRWYTKAARPTPKAYKWPRHTWNGRATGHDDAMLK